MNRTPLRASMLSLLFFPSLLWTAVDAFAPTGIPPLAITSPYGKRQFFASPHPRRQCPVSYSESDSVSFLRAAPEQNNDDLEPVVPVVSEENSALKSKSPPKTKKTPISKVEVWYQLFVNGNAVGDVDTIAIKGVPTIISIKKAVKAQRTKTLKNYEAAELKVYAYTDDKLETSLDREEWNPNEHGGRSLATPLIVTAVDSVPAKGSDEQKAQTEGENFVNSIMGEYESIDESNGMRLLRNVSPIEASSQPENIIVRNITELFWNACLKVVDDSDGLIRVAAIGTPGIGKTTSTAILIRMLLKKGETVVYLVRTNKETSWYYEFTPSNSEDTPSNPKVQVRVYPERNGPTPVESLNHNTTYFIIDPGETQDNCLPSRKFSPKIILVTSPDDKHWGGNEFEKKRAGRYGTFLYFPVWYLEELKAARPFLCPDITSDELDDRFRMFGGVPRKLEYDTDKEAELLFTKQDQAISALTESQLRQLATGEIDGVERTTSKAPMSALIGFFPGKRDDFSDATIEIISPFVGDKILARHIDKVWGIMLSTEFGRSGLFEAYGVHAFFVDAEETIRGFRNACK